MKCFGHKQHVSVYRSLSGRWSSADGRHGVRRRWKTRVLISNYINMRAVLPARHLRIQLRSRVFLVHRRQVAPIEGQHPSPNSETPMPTESRHPALERTRNESWGKPTKNLTKEESKTSQTKPSESTAHPCNSPISTWPSPRSSAESQSGTALARE